MDKGQRPLPHLRFSLSSRYHQTFVFCPPYVRFEMNHFTMLCFSIIYLFPIPCLFLSLSLVFYTAHQTFCFYFFSVSLQCVSSSDCSHSLRIIIIHIFFRFLINSVHMSVKIISRGSLLRWREIETVFNNITFCRYFDSRANVNAYFVTSAGETLSHKKRSSRSNFLNNKKLKLELNKKSFSEMIKMRRNHFLFLLTLLMPG